MNMDVTKAHKEKRKHEDMNSLQKKSRKEKSQFRTETDIVTAFKGQSELDNTSSKHKKKHKEHKQKEKEQELDVSRKLTEDQLINTVRKKKKHKHSNEEDGMKRHPEAQTLNEPVTKKKKKNSSRIETNCNDSITLDMLHKNSTVLVNDLSNMRHGAASKDSNSSQSEPSKTRKKKSKKTKSASKLPSPDSEGSDVDERLQRDQAFQSKGTKDDNDVDDDDQTIISWRNSLEDDLCPEELDFEPSELHLLFPSLRWMTPQEKEEMIKKDVKIRQGKWSHKEDTILRQNLDSFVQKFNVPSVPLILGINKQAKEKVDSTLTKFLQLKKFYFYLGKGLSDRILYSVYQRARKLFHPMDKSKLNPEQMTQMFRLQSKVGNKWSTISELMHKPSKVLFEAARYHTEKRDTGDWTKEENEKLFKAVKRKLRLGEDGTCKKLPWKRIAKKVGTRNANQCCKQWLHNLCWRFSHGVEPKPKWSDQDSLRLIQLLYRGGAETEADLDWNDIFTNFSNVASYSDLHYKWYLLKNQVPDYKEKDLEDILLYLERKYEEKVKKN